MSSVLQPVLSFPELTKNDYSKVGQKAAHIGELTKAKVPVPAGFVITAESYFYFLDMARIREKIVDILANLDIENTKELEEASSLIRDMIIKSTMPPIIENSILKSYAKLSGFVGTLVAVRSSVSYDDNANDSFAGMSETYLNIKGGKDVVLAIKACWASLFEPSSIYYRATKGLSHMKAGMPVIIQKMVQAEVSGVMFTQNPATNDADRIIIEAVLGLGDMVESDTYTPDHYEIGKQGMKIDVKKVSKQTHMIVRSTKHKENEEQIKKVQVADKWQNAQKLEDNKITELAGIGKLIEQYFGEAQDIEWVIEAGKIYIIQTRSIARNDESVHLNPLEKEINPITLSSSVDEVANTQPESTNDEISQAEKQIETLKESSGQMILSGSPASEGELTGRVRIIRQNDDFAKLVAGEILVIDKILPEYILWMRKAGGIITNQGGMTSHAAILSREFKIPCIVGTENATEILDDNELVSMNGNNGRVYLLHDEESSIPQINNIIEPEQSQDDTTSQDSQNEMAQNNDQIIQEEPAPQIVAEDISSPIENTNDENLPELREDFASINNMVPEQHNVEGGQVTYEREESVIPQPINQRTNEPSSIPFKNIRTATRIMVNLSDPQLAEAIAERGADGIGYINGTDILNNVVKKHPEEFIEDEIIEKYVTEIATVLEGLSRHFNPRQVIYRPSNLIPSELKFDWGRFEFKEENPLLGYNGAIKYIQNPSLFNLEIEAIKTVRNRFGYKNISLMLPMIREAKDLREIKKIITSNDLKRSSTFKLYLPIESPSTILLINDLIDIGIDGIFIFAKTLSGLLNAVDMDNPKYKNFPVFNEALMMASEVIIKSAHKNKISTGIILEGKEFEEHALKELISWGAIEISTDPYYLDKTKSMVASIEKDLILSRRR